MILVGNTLISLDILEAEFVCNLSRCKGACCVEGDSGAPLAENEIGLIEENLNAVRPYMTAPAQAMLDKAGFYEFDKDGDRVTRCMGGRDCIFVVEEGGVYKCAIEKASEAGATAFRKPVSCHLYPIRVSQVGPYEALNYSRWDICSDACSLGAQLKVPVYKFLKNALIRNYGEQWYAELEVIAGEYARSK